MQLLMLRIASVLIIAFVYMLFDIFNRRNVPSAFAYATLGYGLLLTFLYFSIFEIAISVAIALVVLGFGYIIYKIGQIGAADIIELAALALMLPLQQIPILFGSTYQFSIPFIASVVIAAGIAALIIVPFYYLPRAKSMLKKPLSSFIDRKCAFRAALIAVPYMAFILFLAAWTDIGIAGIAILFVVMVCSSVISLFERPITDSMVEFIKINKCDEGDIIAFNLMKKSEISAIRHRVKGFDRLLTRKLLAQMKAARIKETLPVYRKALPFAVPIFIGVIFSILLGNVLLAILPL